MAEPSPIYGVDVLAFIKNYSYLINQAATIGGNANINFHSLSPEQITTYMTAFIANEYHNRTRSWTDPAVDALMRSYDEASLQASINRMDANPALRNLKGWARAFGEPLGRPEPAALDVGPANIQIYTQFIF
jgi:hypothetical protein